MKSRSFVVSRETGWVGFASWPYLSFVAVVVDRSQMVNVACLSFPEWTALTPRRRMNRFNCGPSVSDHLSHGVVRADGQVASQSLCRQTRYMSDSDRSNGDQIPEVVDVPDQVGCDWARPEFDSMGEVLVPADHYWGAHTQRSLQHFDIGDDKMPKRVYWAYGLLKQAAAIVNARSGRLPRWKGT